MLTFAEEGNGSGQLEINGHSRPVSYELIVAREEDDTKQVRIRLHAPRDWLLQQGFNGEAILVRDNGTRIQVRREGGLSVEDNVSVTLEGYEETEAGPAAAEQYPELKH